MWGGGVVSAMYGPRRFNAGAWYTGATLLVFAGLGRAIAQQEYREKLPNRTLQRPGGPQRAFSL